MPDPHEQCVIHVGSPGSPAGEDLPQLGIHDWPDLVAAIGRAVGPAWRISGNPDLIWTPLRPARGGRTDDAVRAADLQAAMADDRVRAIVPLRGGAWLLRILDRIDFRVLDARRKPVYLIGFSEWTCLSLVAARHRQAVCVHHTSPQYMLATRPGACLTPRQMQRRWRAIWTSIASIISAGRGGPSRRPLVLQGRLVTPGRPAAESARLIGGNLTLMAALAGTKFHGAAAALGSWLAIEDVNESIGRIDRKLAQMRLSGLLDGVRGVMLGRFDSEGRNIGRDVAELVRLHVGPRVPIVAGCNFGHAWPAAPLLIGRPVRIEAGPDGRVRALVDWPRLPAGGPRPAGPSRRPSPAG